jgi:AhpD family alkylhydroperoxidase
MRLDDRIAGLIAVGASTAANCQPCLQTTVTMALEAGADEHEIAEAIRVGQRVRRGAASKLDEFALGLDYATPPSASTMDGECACHS